MVLVNSFSSAMVFILSLMLCAFKYADALLTCVWVASGVRLSIFCWFEQESGFSRLEGVTFNLVYKEMSQIMYFCVI
jgi:hypothetical protein